MSNSGGVYTWSKVAANNATADNTVNYAEGQAPSSLNDSARAAMTSVAKYRDDISGAIVTTGTSTAYIVSSNQFFDSVTDANGQVIAFTPHTTNGATVTLNVDGLGAKPLRTAPNTELLAGVLIQGTPYLATYNNTDGAFYLQGFYGNPYNVPLGAGMDYWFSVAPNSSFVIPIGQAISRTTYATFFGIIGTTYGIGDGSTTFNLPDKRGRVSVAADSGAGRISTATLSTAGIGGVGGAETETLTAAQIPTITGIASGTITVTSTISDIVQSPATPATNTIPGSGLPGLNNTGTGVGAVTSTGSASLSVTSNNTGGGSHVNMQPTIVCNYIIRII